MKTDTPPTSDAIAPSDAAEWDRVMNPARNAVHDTDGRGMIGSNRNHLSQRVARAILHAEKAAREIAAQPGEGDKS